MPRLSSHRGGPPASLFFLGNVARKPGWKKTNQNRRYSFTNKTDQIEDIQYIFFEVSIMKINSHEYLLFGQFFETLVFDQHDLPKKQTPRGFACLSGKVEKTVRFRCLPPLGEDLFATLSYNQYLLCDREMSKHCKYHSIRALSALAHQKDTKQSLKISSRKTF